MHLTTLTEATATQGSQLGIPRSVLKLEYKHLLAEAPQVGGTKRMERTGWIRLTVIDDTGSLWIVDAREENVLHRPASEMRERELRDRLVARAMEASS